jgi:choline dehydrogenase-like flavoprotein
MSLFFCFPLVPGLSVLVQTRSHESAKKATLQIRFVIVGGGPAGLACAVALRRVGHHVIVLEKGPDFIGVRTTPVPFQAGSLVIRLAQTKVSHSQAGTAGSVFHRT